MGVALQPEGGVHFRVWAADRARVAIEFDTLGGEASGERIELAAEGEGWFSGSIAAAVPGDLYYVRLDDEERYADPASRFQPEGPHGPSQIVDPAAFDWTDGAWRGVPESEIVLYELHVGTFTPEGTWQAAACELPALAELGATMIEVMPVADFPGRFGWGYDGVNFFAPTRLYGGPDDFRFFVNAAHRAGIGVILDVVYNHAGPDGNFLPRFSRAWFSRKHKTDWGPAFNFDGPGRGPVRRYFIENAGYWIDEFHLDGLRLDATQNVYDDSTPHILQEVTARVRAAAGDRRTFVVAENEPQDVWFVKPPVDERIERMVEGRQPAAFPESRAARGVSADDAPHREPGGCGMDALWNDDFHHAAMVLLSGRSEAYYTDYRGSAQEFVSAAKWGFLYQGQWYKWQKQRRGTPALDLPPEKFVHFIQNHDQVANTCRGLRCHEFASAGCHRALTALLLLGPQTPMLFQGQEFAASAPFFFFADHREELARQVHAGRREFLKQFRSIASPEIQARLPDPADPATFVRCKLDFGERSRYAAIYQMHRDLLRLRRVDPVLSARRCGGVDGAVLGERAFVLRFFAADGMDRLLFVNFAVDLNFDPAPEPLLAPPGGCEWEILWSSEDFAYGGTGTAALDTEENWRIPGHAAVLLAPVRSDPLQRVESPERNDAGKTGPHERGPDEESSS
ncbi:MAG: alpha-amylase family glycosyl hydrolase [Planctomycetaceae bacterium]